MLKFGEGSTTPLAFLNERPPIGIPEFDVFPAFGIWTNLPLVIASATVLANKSISAEPCVDESCAYP